MQINFVASLHSVKVDREGEAKITLTIPKSELISVLELAQDTEKLLSVQIEIEDAKRMRNDRLNCKPSTTNRERI